MKAKIPNFKYQLGQDVWVVYGNKKRVKPTHCPACGHYIGKDTNFIWGPKKVRITNIEIEHRSKRPVVTYSAKAESGWCYAEGRNKDPFHVSYKEAQVEADKINKQWDS